MDKKLENLKKERESIIKNYSGKNIPETHIEGEVKKREDILHVIIKDIISETEDTKSFILVPNKEKGTSELPPFKAGQYISLKLEINGEYATRAYSISSGPDKNYYRITIKKVPNGLVSNFMFNEANIGDTLEISRPTGVFGYNKIRDEQNVIAIAGGSGITPFISLAEAIVDGKEDCDLTVIYSVKTENDIIFAEEIKEINAKSKRVKILITLTKEEKEGYLTGRINKEMLEPYIKEFNTVLMCGPEALYETMNDILNEFNIPEKCVRYENFFSEYKPTSIETYNLKVILKNDFVLTECHSNETLLVSMEHAGIKAPSSCRVGICGFCRSILLEGKVKMVGGDLKTAEKDNDYIHPCVSYPESDIVLRLDI